MRLQWLAPGMTLDGYGNLWVDVSVESVQLVVGPCAGAALVDAQKVSEMLRNLEHLGVKHVRPFFSMNN